MIDARRGAGVVAMFLCTACASAGSTAAVPASSERAALAHHIDSLISQPMFRTAEWAILVVDPARSDTLYAHNASMLMVPASNMKIITSAVAATQLGLDFRYVTTFATRGSIANGTLSGDLVVTGRGDPTLSDHMRGNAATAISEIADSVVAHGIHAINGRIVSGADNFPGSPLGAGWEWDDLGEDYAAGVDELYYNEGMTSVVVHRANGDTTVTRPSVNPTHDYLVALQRALGARGVNATLGVADSSSHGAAREDTIFTVRSVPLAQILPAFLKPSQNQIGEILLRTVGLEKTGVGTADSGIAVTARQLAAWEIPSDGYVINDGSGLARSDLLTPQTIVAVLARMLHSAAFPVYYAALPIAGVDGTIANRMKNTPAANDVHAKTGSLGWVRSLSGYLDNASGRRLVFSILCNKWTTSSVAVTSTADSIAASLARLH